MEKQNIPSSHISKTSKFFLSLAILILVAGTAYYFIRQYKENKKYSAEGQAKILEDMEKTNVHQYSPEEMQKISESATVEDQATPELSDQQKRDLLDSMMHQ